MNDRWPRLFPMSGDSPGGGDDTLWLNMIVYELKKQTLNAREKGGVEKGKRIDDLSFLMPMSFEETLSHDWEEHQGITNRIAEVVRSLDMSVGEAKAVLDAGGKLARFEWMEALRETAGANVSDIKPDTPLIYKGSSRRELPITIQLADQGNIRYDVMEPINRLREYSSPAHDNKMFRIKFPHVFELQTITGLNKRVPIFSMRMGVLRSVQPTFEGPYREGYPSRCELTLTFTDMELLYRESLQRKGNVSASVLSRRDVEGI